MEVVNRLLFFIQQFLSSIGNIWTFLNTTYSFDIDLLNIHLAITPLVTLATGLAGFLVTIITIKLIRG